MSDDEVSEFIIGRLAELVGVLLNDHVGAGADDRRVRSDSIAILMALGNWAAEHGRPDLLPQLHGLARKVEATPAAKPEGLNAKMVKRVSFE